MRTLVELIAPFIAAVRAGQVEIYNEFSLQHELGIFLRGALPNDIVRFERNVSFFFPTRPFTKREIDIVVVAPGDRELKWVIELKYPRNGQYPEQMFSFCKDVVFAEELKEAGFRQSAVLIFADDPLFSRGALDGIYGFLRGGRPLNGRIQKPTGARDVELTIRGVYTVNWQQISSQLSYAVIEA